MGKRALSKEQLLENKEEILELYHGTHRKADLPRILTKKEKKVLGIGKDEGRATHKYARISSRKVKLVIDLIKGKSLDEAYAIVRYTPKAASEILYKLLKSAEANAIVKELNRDELFVADAYAYQGPTLKRIRARARGSASKIKKRSSHVTVVVKEREED